MEFYTLDKKITVKNGWINQQIIKAPDGLWIKYLLVVVVLILLMFTYENDTKAITLWLFNLLLFGSIFSGFIKLYKHIFVFSWKHNIRLTEIVSISKKEIYQGLETEVTCILKSGRKKIYVFRAAENVAETFISEINFQII